MLDILNVRVFFRAAYLQFVVSYAVRGGFRRDAFDHRVHSPDIIEEFYFSASVAPREFDFYGVGIRLCPTMTC
jgi:hypothetical protein